MDERIDAQFHEPCRTAMISCASSDSNKPFWWNVFFIIFRVALSDRPKDSITVEVIERGSAVHCISAYAARHSVAVKFESLG